MSEHKKVEEEMLKFWEKSKIYEKSKKKNEDGDSFYFCDGPPYATGQIHPGTGWNKVIKDSVCRYWRMEGRNVRCQPGYDTHGLPIEVKVEHELKMRHKHDIEKFIEKCKAFATKYIGVMGKQFERLGVWMDWESPYITYRDHYIDSSWMTLKMAWDKGLMHEGVYVLPYCYRCETTMANYELEYGEETDPSIFVKFRVRGKKNEYLIIWTTTPWTLVANMAVMAHPIYAYVKVQVDDEVWYLAKERLDYLMELTGKSATLIEEMPGRKLNGMQYEHLFQDKISKEYDRKIVLSDEYVTLEEGTGLVHTAPGHGLEDFIIGKRYEIETFCPVDSAGKYTKEAGKVFEGKNVREANPMIIKLMKKNGTLVYEERIKHRYPHCWRCKTPLIFLTTKQWFISVSKIKDRMLAEIGNTEWHPNFAKERFREFVTNAPDWCISRQRYWGIPLPIWRCECGKIKVIGSKKEIPDVKELHRPYIDKVMLPCECGGKMKRVEDVLDVWFDSGNAVWAPLSEKEKKRYGEVADLIIEGQDQIRGWFYSLLGSGVVRYDATPYKRLLMHGFFVDEHGEKMSKSLGNFVPLEDIMEKYGADTFRMWGMSSTIWDELKFSWEDMKKCSSDLNIIFNLTVFLERFYPKKKIEGIELTAADKWITSRMNNVIKEYRKAFDSTEPNRGMKALRQFITEDFSRFYMKIAKDRITKKENEKAALQTIYNVLFNSLVMLAPVSPFLSEHLYRRFFRKYEKIESIHLMDMIREAEDKIDNVSEKHMEIIREIASSALLARQSGGIKTRWPIRTLYIESKSHEAIDAVRGFENVLKMLLNAKGVEVIEETPKGNFSSEEFSNGKVHIDKKIDEELYEEGMMNEVKRRIQSLRKTENLVEKDTIKVYVSSESEMEEIIKKNEKTLMKSVSAKSIEFREVSKMKEDVIDGRHVKLAIKTVK
jgi:isoleucyl-tRNA synthetase